MLELNCTEKLTINILKQGHIPEHMSFIMDGNRRYAISKNKQSYKGHQDGKESLKTYLLYCFELGVKEASFFCFSIQNFKRSQIQVNKLMELVLQTFQQISQVCEFLQKKNIQVRIIGKIDLFRKDVADCLKRVQQSTKNNASMIINLCFAYDSLDQINNAIMKAQIQKGNNIICYQQVYKNLMITRPVDILIRTSNEHRLSNFMLMQNCYSLIFILKQNWPEINLWSLIKIMLHYNIHFKQIQKKKLSWKNNFEYSNNQNKQSFRIDEQSEKLL